MKNFPHQFSDPAKLRAALGTVVDLEQRGDDADDDGVFGYELARRAIYRFRGLSYEDTDLDARIATRIEREGRKAPGSQGARTAARDVRRTLILLGFLTAELELTDLGKELLDAPLGSDQEQQLWRAALINLRLEGNDNAASHPVRVLLRLAELRPFHRRVGTELALEAADDSEEELDRLTALIDLGPAEMDRQLITAGATRRTIDNARKIIPALSIHSGLLASDDQRRLRITPDGAALVQGAAELGPLDIVGTVVGPAPLRAPRTPRRVTALTAARVRTVRGRRTLTPEEQAEAARRLAERTDRHQRLVQRIAPLAGRAALYEDEVSFDLLMVPDDGPLVLWEAKTIDLDAPTQIRSAVGQLLYYKHFHVEPEWPGREVLLGIVVDRPIAEELVDFLSSLGIGVLLLADDLSALNELGEHLRDRLEELDLG